MNQLRENHGTKIVTEMLLVMLLNDLSVKLVVTEPQKGCGLSSLNLVRMKWFPRFIGWVSIFYCYSGSCRRLC